MTKSMDGMVNIGIRVKLLILTIQLIQFQAMQPQEAHMCYDLCQGIYEAISQTASPQLINKIIALSAIIKQECELTDQFEVGERTSQNDLSRIDVRKLIADNCKLIQENNALMHGIHEWAPRISKHLEEVGKRLGEIQNKL